MAFRDFIGPTAQVVAIVAAAAGAVFWLAKLEGRVERLESATNTPAVRTAIDGACRDVIAKILGYSNRPQDFPEGIAMLEKMRRDLCPLAKN